MKQAVLCMVPNLEKAELVVDTLKGLGFLNNDISILFPDKGLTRDVSYEAHTKAPEGIATGAGAGAIVGGALGWLAGIGSLMIPGVGACIAAGPIMAALSGAAIGGGVGGLTGGLLGLGIPEIEAKMYEGKVRSGKILVCTHCETNEQADNAEDVYKNLGGTDIKRTIEAKPAAVK